MVIYYVSGTAMLILATLIGVARMMERKQTEPETEKDAPQATKKAKE